MGQRHLKMFDLVEIQAQAAFAEETVNTCEMPSIRFLKQVRGTARTLKARVFLDENIGPSGCLATFPNPSHATKAL